MSKEFKFSKDAINKMVRKTWLLWMQWQNSNHDVDHGIYLRQRELTEEMLKKIPEDIRSRCALP